MIEHAVQDHTDPALVGLLYEQGKERIAGLEIFFGADTGDVAGGMPVVRIPRREQIAAVRDDPSQMRIDVGVILRIVFMSGR